MTSPNAERIDRLQPQEFGFTVRPMAQADVPLVVETHLSAFPGFFLSFLGPRFLALFYGEKIGRAHV